jgi:alpha-1,3-mannosyltransferase
MKELRAEIEGLGSRYLFQSSDVNPHINGTVEPNNSLSFETWTLRGLLEHPKLYAEDKKVVFLNGINIINNGIITTRAPFMGLTWNGSIWVNIKHFTVYG